MDKDSIKVFVYGSLKKGGNVRGMQFFQDAIHVGQAFTTAGIYDMDANDTAYVRMYLNDSATGSNVVDVNSGATLFTGMLIG